MNPDTGEIRDLRLDKNANADELEQAFNHLVMEANRDGFTVLIPGPETKKVKKMSMLARIRWAKKQRENR